MVDQPWVWCRGGRLGVGWVSFPVLKLNQWLGFRGGLNQRVLLNRRRGLLNRCGLLNRWWVFESISVARACLNRWEWWRQGDQIGGCVLHGFQLLSFAFWTIVGFIYCGLNQWLELVWINVESGRAMEIRLVVSFLPGLSDFGHPFAPCSHLDPNLYHRHRQPQLL